jgi:hypothetical protein
VFFNLLKGGLPFLLQICFPDGAGLRAISHLDFQEL